MKTKLLISGAVIASVLTIGTVVYAVQPKEQPKSSVTTSQPSVEPTPETQPVVAEAPAVQTPPAPKPVAKVQSTPPPVKDLRTIAREQYINADTRARLSTMEGWSTIQEPYFWQCFEDSVIRLKVLDPNFQGWESEAAIMKLVSISSYFSIPCDSRDKSRIWTSAMGKYCQPNVQPLSCSWN